MNNFKKYAYGIGAGAGTAIAMIMPLFAKATLEADITSVASTVGVAFQAGALVMLEQSLIYVIPVTILFLAVRYLWRKLKGAAH